MAWHPRSTPLTLGAMGKQFAWFAADQRTDDLGGGRTARTVFYRHTHHRIGYTGQRQAADRASDG